MRVLVIEEGLTGHALSWAFKETCFEVQETFSASEGIRLAGELSFDIIILDRELEDADADSVLREIRSLPYAPPVFVVSKRSSPEDIAEVLRIGADGYLSKPFDKRELFARLEAIVASFERHKRYQGDPVLTAGILSINVLSRTCSVQGKKLNLTDSEYNIFKYLMSHQGRPISQRELMGSFKEVPLSMNGSIVCLLSRLRKKIVFLSGNRERGAYIQTRRNAGYMIHTP